MGKLVYFKLLQVVVTMVFIWHLLSLHQFCGTFNSPNVFLGGITFGHCKRFTLIGIDPKTGEYGAVYDEKQWKNQLWESTADNGGKLMEERRQEIVDELAERLPAAGRQCIPISLSLLSWTNGDTNRLDNILNAFSFQLFVALMSLVALCTVTLNVLLLSPAKYGAREIYSFFAYLGAFHSVFSWCVCAVWAAYLLIYWAGYWACINFNADYTDAPMIELVISIVMACSSVFEIFFNDLLIREQFNASATTTDYKLRNDVATGCTNVVVHQQQQKNGCAIMRT